MTSPTLTPSLRNALRRAERGDWASSAYGRQGVSRATYVVEFFEAAGKPMLVDIGSEELASLREHLRSKRLAASTINGYLAALASLYTAARESPALTTYRPDIDRLHIKTKRNRILSDAEEAAMCRFFSEDADMLDISLLALDTGLRESELLRLHAHDGLDLDDPELASVIVRSGKSTASAAAVALTLRAAEIVQRRAAASPRGTLFAGIKQHTVIRRWNKFREHMGLSSDPGFTFHCLRHTTCTRLIDSGVDLEAAQTFLRHEHISTTLKYVKASARRTRAARDVLQARKPRHVEAPC